MMVFSEAGGEWVFLSLPSEKLSAISGILLMVLYLLMLDSEVEPRRLDFRWLKGPEGEKANKSRTRTWSRLQGHSLTTHVMIVLYIYCRSFYKVLYIYR